MDKTLKRKRRAIKTRVKCRQLDVIRLCIHRSANNIYAQVISSCGSKVLTQASTLDKALRSELPYGGNKDAAAKVGKVIAQRCMDLNIKKLAFDRSGFKYHGRIKALADAAREAGLEF